MVKTYLFKKHGLMLCVTLLGLASCKKDDAILPSSDNLKAESTIGAAVDLSESAMSVGSIQSLLSGSTLQTGIVGHPFGSEPYKNISAATQIKLVKGMGMNWYRIGTLVTSTGEVTVPKLFNPLLEEAAAGNVNILPMVYLRTMDFNDTQQESYAKGKTLGANFAAKYGKYFTYYNLGNDLELDLLLPKTTGQSQAHYDRAKFNVTAAYLKGMDDGIKSKDPGAKTMIGAGWLHYGFLRMLEWYGVNYDVVAYQWYSDMENAAPKAPNNIPDITLKLSSLFPNKPIWFTEFNYRYKASYTLEQNEAAQKEFIANFLVKCRNNPQVKVAIAYELLDEPVKSFQESNYGLLKWVTPFTAFKNKISATALQLK
ncbi:hypothetical protein FPZ43_11395 [Mucilaginibacter pallidiroseus]|uniref:Arabinogalactan endo-beta-1,4-galactanase n=1 Tax=Mucilaginibacter pallidiroseus TaxID=2599295 RepID=A0A563UBW4_9SPHI|nr:hypothetical protein [Mucilaginibacter pallidiroseus]TWR28868.1 hypothetical protein FPZ43_11395 [Mucilaginibacter pallidiroseus]